MTPGAIEEGLDRLQVEQPQLLAALESPLQAVEPPRGGEVEQRPWERSDRDPPFHGPVLRDEAP